ncbi:hypothetical protein [Corynebacterium pseudogenitalium]|uniref:hypothetical protein n=1 Tax=Corynebacterium pseudogenitalium TaxID=38303 RepID=UPI00210E2D76|nr:hypothetical protein [Corynebacterium pseudogenitalium]UUA86709.1 hypothetical protein KBP54_08045 [Corynebacterium pseudogenitalium]
MITVLSAEPYNVAGSAKREDTCVILPRADQPIVLGEDLGDAEFHKSVRFEEVQPGARTIFVNAPAEESVLRPEIKNLASFEYWVDSQNLSNLCDCLRNGRALTIVGINSDGNWLKLLMQPEENRGRPATDLLRGIELAVYVAEAKTETAPPVLAQPPRNASGFGTLFINVITPYAKPLKEYLPKGVVAVLYKLLEKIR